MATKSKISSAANVRRRKSGGSLINDRKERLSISTRERKSSAPSIEETFENLFKGYCVQFKPWIIPDVRIVPHEPPPGDFPKFASETSLEEIPAIKKEMEEKKSSKDLPPSVPAVLIIYDNYDMPTVLNTVIFKRFLVDRSMLIALRKTLQKFNTVGTLKFEFCGLENTHLRTLKTILQTNEVITDLSINGNPNRFQNFYILLKGTKLSHVSMRFCQINDRGVHLIAHQLSSSFDQTLISLNLSSNFISDEGAISIANALRINRNLLFLNFADNWLTDNGCSALMSGLKRFCLNHEEIVTRRRRIMNFLLKKAEMTENQKLQALQGSDSQSLQSGSRKLSKDLSATKTGKDTSTRKSSRGSAGSPHTKITSKKSFELDTQLIEQMVDLELGTDNHPFVKDSYPENMEIYCKGNFKLIYLNLAYNKITLQGLLEIIATLQYQQTMTVNVPEGLSNITLEGNLISECCNEISDFNELIKESYSRRFSNVSSDSRRSLRRKRSGPSRISITL